MSMFSRRRRGVPELNTASLPDLIFTVLFFFMIVTHMRTESVKVRFQVPQGKELSRLVKKSTVSYIYIGRPQKSAGAADTRIQLNDKFVTAEEVEDYMSAEKTKLSPEDIKQQIVSIKADKNTKMGVITDVKEALRRANTLNINYSANESK